MEQPGDDIAKYATFSTSPIFNLDRSPKFRCTLDDLSSTESNTQQEREPAPILEDDWEDVSSAASNTQHELSLTCKRPPPGKGALKKPQTNQTVESTSIMALDGQQGQIPDSQSPWHNLPMESHAQAAQPKPIPTTKEERRKALDSQYDLLLENHLKEVPVTKSNFRTTQHKLIRISEDQLQSFRKGKKLLKRISSIGSDIKQLPISTENPREEYISKSSMGSDIQHINFSDGLSDEQQPSDKLLGSDNKYLEVVQENTASSCPSSNLLVDPLRLTDTQHEPNPSNEGLQRRISHKKINSSGSDMRRASQSSNEARRPTAQLKQITSEETITTEDSAESSEGPHGTAILQRTDNLAVPKTTISRDPIISQELGEQAKKMFGKLLMTHETDRERGTQTGDQPDAQPDTQQDSPYLRDPDTGCVFKFIKRNDEDCQECSKCHQKHVGFFKPSHARDLHKECKEKGLSNLVSQVAEAIWKNLNLDDDDGDVVVVYGQCAVLACQYKSFLARVEMSLSQCQKADNDNDLRIIVETVQEFLEKLYDTLDSLEHERVKLKWKIEFPKLTDGKGAFNNAQLYDT